MSDTAHRNSLQPGYLLHWYRIDRVLGQGGFGITYLAHDTNLDHPVALKEYLPMELAVREGDQSVQPASSGHHEQYRWGLDRFVTEARTLAKFRHRCIVRVLSVFEANNTAYMVMEYERGETLADLLSRRRTLPESELRPLLFPLLDGLEAIHAAGFIHRDIKPANVVVRADGTPALIDFGSARQALGQHTRTLTSIISPGYAPYEQYLSKGGRQGPWTDVYGLAATLYRAVAGRAPLDALDRSEALLKMQRDLYAPLSERSGGQYAQAFLIAVDRGLQFRETDRPQSVAAWRPLFDAEGAEAVTVIEPAPLVMNAAAAAVSAHVVSDPLTVTNRWRRRWLGALAAFAVVAVAAYAVRPLITRPLQAPVAEVRTVPSAPDAATRAGAIAESPAVTATPDVLAGTNGDAARGQSENAGTARLLAQARRELAADRLDANDPTSATAVYREILKRDAQNTEARAALASIAVTFAERALGALREHREDQAAQWLADAEDIDPDAPLVGHARRQLNAVRSVAASPPASAAAPPVAVAKPDTRTPVTSTAGPAPASSLEIAALIRLAEEDLAANRLSTPPGRNAIARYQEALKRDPSDARARAGIDAVAARYATLARQALSRAEVERAQTFYDRGKAIRSGLSDWDEIGRAIATAREQQARASPAAAPSPPDERYSAPIDAAATAPVAPEVITAAVPAQTATRAPASSPSLHTVLLGMQGIGNDYQRYGLSEADLRAAVAERLRSAGYQVSDASESAPDALALKLVLHTAYNTTAGLYSYSTRIEAKSAAGALLWSGGESGTTQAGGLRQLNGIFLKHVDQFLATHPAR